MSGMKRAQRKDVKFAEVRNFFGDPEKAAAYAAKVLKWGAVYQRDCLKCGCPLGFAKSPEGKTIPLDLRAPVYGVAHRDDRPEEEPMAIRTTLQYVSHFATCPHANDFSGVAKNV